MVSEPTCAHCPKPLLTAEDQVRGFHVLCAPPVALAQRLGVPTDPGALQDWLDRREEERMTGG